MRIEHVRPMVSALALGLLCAACGAAEVTPSLPTTTPPTPADANAGFDAGLSLDGPKGTPRPMPTANLTPAVPCSHDSRPACTGTPPSFAKDVEPILAKRCFACHAGQGEVANEHSFTRMPSVLAHRKGIARRVAACSMPPPPNPPLPEAEAKTIIAWAVCGN